MSPKERLLFTLLITTGMRLDEVCLLNWEQIKTDGNGIRYVDLSINPIKNDKFSKRNVAIPDAVLLPPREVGRLFNYRLDDDLKSSKAASRKLNEKYLHKIRLNEKDDRKVVHSLRHNVTGFIANNDKEFIEYTLELFSNEILWNKIRNNLIKKKGLKNWTKVANNLIDQINDI